MSLIRPGNKVTGFYNSPAGNLKIDSDGNHIIAVSFMNDDIPSLKDTQPVSCSEIIEKCIEELDAYFRGKGKEFSVPFQSSGTDFQQKVWQQVKAVPYGKTITYSALAERLGSVKLTRAVGQANGKNPLAILVPCHRVVGKNNELQGYAWGISRKRQLLELEGSISIHRQMTLF